MNPEFDQLFKVRLIGDKQSGKSSIILRFCDDTYTTDPITSLGACFKVRTLNINQQKVKLNIWDTTDFDRSNGNIYRGCHGVFLVFDLTNLESFSKVQYQYFHEIDRYASENISIIIVGCKCDILSDAVVDFATINKFAKEKRVRYMECSSKFSINIDDIFSTLALDIMAQIERNKLSQNSSGKVLIAPPYRKKKKKSGCSRNIQ